MILAPLDSRIAALVRDAECPRCKSNTKNLGEARRFRIRLPGRFLANHFCVALPSAPPDHGVLPDFHPIGNDKRRSVY